MLPAAFVRLAQLPLTPNGKLDRKALPAPAHEQLLLAAPYTPPATSQETLLAQLWAQLLGLSRVGIHDNFFALGGDSLLSVRMIARAGQAGLRLTPQQVFAHQTIAELAGLAVYTTAERAEQALSGALPLTPSQKRFFQFDHPQPHHYNTSSLTEFLQPLDPLWLQQAFQQVLIHHDGLRQVFQRTPAGWAASIAQAPTTPPLHYFDISCLSEVEQRTCIEDTAARLQKNFCLSEGPLVRVALFECGADRAQRLLVITHHLVTDAQSSTIWTEDLITAYQQLQRGQAVRLPAKTTSIKAWAERLVAHANSGALKQEAAYWLAEPRKRVSRMPLDYPEGVGKNTEGSAWAVRSELSSEETGRLLNALQRLRVEEIQVSDILLAALAQTYADWAGEQQFLVQLANHGRFPLFDGVDLSRTVSFISFHFPMFFDIAGQSTLMEVVRAIKEQNRALPQYGIGYDLLRYLSGDEHIAAQLQALPAPEISFNYFGQQRRRENSWSRPARESAGPTHDPLQSRLTFLYCRARIADERLSIDWGYSEHIHSDGSQGQRHLGF